MVVSLCLKVAARLAQRAEGIPWHPRRRPVQDLNLGGTDSELVNRRDGS